MLQKITDLWPTLLQHAEALLPDDDEPADQEPGELSEGYEDIEETFKNLRWTRVIPLRDFEEMSTHVYSMSDDIKIEIIVSRAKGVPFVPVQYLHL